MKLSEAAEAWLDGAERGVIRARNGERFKPGTLRSYERSLRLRVVPRLGRLRLSDITRNQVQDLVDILVADGLDASTISNTLIALSTICRRAVTRGELGMNPCTGVIRPSVEGRRDRAVAPAMAEALIDALPARERALWATALYGGLRRGELQALEWRCVDLDQRVIEVQAGWDPGHGRVAPKSRAGVRSIPMAESLRRRLLEHLILHGRDRDGLVFGVGSRPFDPSTCARRARKGWAAADLEPITLHEARHCAASFMLAAGIDVKALSTFLGHTSVSITLDRYAHLLPDALATASARLDGLLSARTSG